MFCFVSCFVLFMSLLSYTIRYIHPRLLHTVHQYIPSVQRLVGWWVWFSGTSSAVDLEKCWQLLGRKSKVPLLRSHLQVYEHTHYEIQYIYIEISYSFSNITIHVLTRNIEISWNVEGGEFLRTSTIHQLVWPSHCRWRQGFLRLGLRWSREGLKFSKVLVIQFFPRFFYVFHII